MKHYKNIKVQILNIKNIVIKSKIIIFLFVFSIILFLVFNIISSQFVSPLYFNFVNNDEISTINFLQKINSLPEYKKIIEMNDNIFNSTIKAEIFRRDNLKKGKINNLEQQLTINPRSRDVLYSLYQLYLSEEDNVRANYYLRMAREIDPGIK